MLVSLMVMNLMGWIRKQITNLNKSKFSGRLSHRIHGTYIWPKLMAKVGKYFMDSMGMENILQMKLPRDPITLSDDDWGV